MEGGNNGPAIINGLVNNFDRAVCFDAPVAYDTGLYVYPTKTLLQLRNELMTRLGFAAMVSYPPPGMPELLNSFLQDAQEQLYLRPGGAPLRTERWWAWQLTAGRRFYDTPIDCTKALDFRRITGAYIADNGGRALQAWTLTTALTSGTFVNSSLPTDFEYEVTTPGTTGATEPTWPTTVGGTVVDGTVHFTARAPATATWHPLKQGINPLEYNLTNQAMPYRFELHEYLELWPSPEKTYVVWLKGHLGVRKFTEDTDTTTIDSRLVFLMALANAKAHYGQPDGNMYFKQCEVMLGRLVAGSHGIRRYIPNPVPIRGDYYLWDALPLSLPRATFR